MNTKQLNEMLKFAGLPIREEKDDASPHITKEKALFEQCCDCLSQVEKMCDARLAEKDLTDEHKKQYTELCECAKDCCEVMKKHLASYK